MDDDYERLIKETIKKMEAQGIKPCDQHGWQSMNWDGSCEICRKEDFPEDFRGTE